MAWNEHPRRAMDTILSQIKARFGIFNSIGPMADLLFHVAVFGDTMDVLQCKFRFYRNMTKQIKDLEASGRTKNCNAKHMEQQQKRLGLRQT